MRKRALMLAVICSSWCVAAYAADSSAPAPLPNGNADSQSVAAEVTVEAHKEKMNRLRLEIKKSVDDFYDAFNKANTEPSYETHCADERPAGSYIARHVCTPRLMHDATEQETQGLFYGYATVPAVSLITLRMRGYKKRLRQLIHDDPNVHRAALHFESLTEQYAATSVERVRPY
ncbi:MAG TPA: hypothetical protein VGM97_21940 [Steroidobacteraceae bacterium]